MEQMSLSLLAFLVMLVLTCVPPAASLILATRRFAWVQPRYVRMFRWAIIGSAAILVLNLAISTFSVPSLSGETILRTEHLLALGLSWVCFLGAIALVVFFPRRHRIIA